MNELLNKLDTTRLLIALKTCLAIILAFAIALQLDWKPSFMAIVIVVLQTDALGATLKKGLLYIAGTLPAGEPRSVRLADLRRHGGPGRLVVGAEHRRDLRTRGHAGINRLPGGRCGVLRPRDTLAHQCRQEVRKPTARIPDGLP